MELKLQENKNTPEVLCSAQGQEPAWLETGRGKEGGGKRQWVEI